MTQEIKATMVVKMDIIEASAKVRTGPPVDDEEDYDDDIWAGVLPIFHETCTPTTDPRLKEDITLPEYLKQSDHLWAN